jgi:hypothetical protein
LSNRAPGIQTTSISKEESKRDFFFKSRNKKNEKDHLAIQIFMFTLSAFRVHLAVTLFTSVK